MFWKRPDDETDHEPATLPAAAAAPVLTPAQRIRQAEADLKIKALEEAARFEREKREAERADWERARAAEHRAEKAVQARVKWRERLGQAIAMFPITVTTAMAMIGQFSWGLANLNQIGSSRDDLVRVVVVFLFAAGLESLGLFLGYHADRAIQRRDSAFGMYLGAFTVSGIVGALNYSHYANTAETVTVLGLDVPAPTPTAVVFALFSFINPALWRVHSRAKNRDRLKENGEIDTRAVRLSWSRKVWHPIRTVRTMYWATWDSTITTPADAVALYEAKVEERHKVREARRATKQAPEKAADRNKAPAPTQGKHRGEATDTPPLPEIVTKDPEKVEMFEKAWTALTESWRAGNTLGQRLLAKDHLNNNRHHARALLNALQKWEEGEAA